MIDQTTVAQGLAGLAGLALAGRSALSWWRKQEQTDTLRDEREEFTNQLKAEIAELRIIVAELRSAHDEHLKLIAELEKSNALMRMLLKMRGITDEELATVGIK